MTPAYEDEWLTLYGGDCREVLASLPADSVDCVVTSPPYYGLRDYGTAQWEGGDPQCDHQPPQKQGATGQRADRTFTAVVPFRDQCGKCSATRIDRQIGLEESPEEYVANMVSVFAGVRRVLKPTGTVWLNLGDSYASSGGERAYGSYDGQTGRGPGARRFRHTTASASGEDREERSSEVPEIRQASFVDRTPALKPKDLIGIPWRVAFALQADGWYLRSDIIWAKKNGMPESVTDRPTRAHEYIFLLTKNARYYYDADAVRQEPAQSTVQRLSQNDGHPNWNGQRDRGFPGSDQTIDINKMLSPGGANLRDVWWMATMPYPDAHFAVFPPELPERCIKAGSSEKGVCPECGAPWERVVERSGLLDLSRPQAKRAKELADKAGLTVEHIAAIRAVGVTDVGKARVTQDGTGKNTEEVQRLADEAKKALGGYYREFLLDRGQTTGWKAGCLGHDGKAVPEPVPAVVLDPFGGSGTTGMVANRLSRRAILIDLNPDYLKQQMKRNANVPLGLTA